MGRRKGKAVRNNKTSGAAAAAAEDDETSRAPHSFVVHKGQPGKPVQELTRDFRKVMEPFTASNVKVRPKNTVKDFAHIAGMLHVSHLAMFTKTEIGPYLKLARFPRGPTMTFRIRDYVLARDVRSALKRQVTYDKQFANHPLLVMNSFGGGGGADAEAGGRHVQLMASMFQNMFPSINVNKVHLNTIRRCVLLNYRAPTDDDDDDDSGGGGGFVEFRHYTIKVVPVGMSRSVKKVIQGKIPNLSRYEDVSEFMTRPGNLSESEFEDDEASHVTLPQQAGLSSRGNLPSATSSIRLVELGPRMSLELIKIEEGLHDGEVLYHKLVQKTDEEKAVIRAAREKKKKEKERRKRQQAENVRAKDTAKADAKEKSLAGMKKLVKKEDLPEGFHGGAEDDKDESDDDAKWYESEVGVKPEADLFDGPRRRRGSPADAAAGGAGGRKRKAESMERRFKSKKHRVDGEKRIRSNDGGGGGSKARRSGGGGGGGGEARRSGGGGRGGEARKSGGSKFSVRLGMSPASAPPPPGSGKRRKASKGVFNKHGVGPNFKPGKNTPSAKKKKR